MRIHLLGAKRPLAVTATVALATLGMAAPVAAAPAPDDGETAVVDPQNTNTEPVTIDFVGITDLHGYIETTPYMQTQINEIRDENANTLFSSSGDSIGGSAYVSAIADDEPTLDVLNEMGLDVSSVGNHEFDKGYADLRDRVLPLVDFLYLGANVGGAPEINDPLYETFEMDGVTVAYIGTVTETTPSIVAADGVAGLTFNDPVATTNDIAADLKDGDDANGEADVVVSLFHEGDSFATGMSDDIDLVFAGHTHINNENVTDAGAPILQAGQHGENFARATLTVDTEGQVTVDQTSIVELNEDVTPDPAVKAIVDDAIAESEVLGAEVLAEITENAYRGTNDGTDMGANRGTESSFGNHLANAARMTANNVDLDADFGIINPGGIRNDMDSEPAGGDGEVTYGEAFSAQPFGNTVGTLDLTGAQVYEMLEQQFQPEQSRPVLRLGLSDNVTYTYDPTADDGGDITGVWIDGNPVALDATYRVASNTFLLAGGDNFDVFTEGQNFVETGIVDLEGYVTYLREGEADTIPEGQRSIGITGDLTTGQTAELNLSSLVFTALEDKPTTVTVYLNGDEAGSSEIDTTVIATRDETGTATIPVTVPGDAPADSELRIVTAYEDGTVDTDVTVPMAVGEQPVRSEGNWFFVSDDWTSTIAATEFGFGRKGDDVYVGDWDNDGKDTFAVRRGNTFYVTNELTGGYAETEFTYGRVGDEVIVGDWNGDGYDHIGVRRGNAFFLMNELKSGNADAEFDYGRMGDEVLVGDWDGDGLDTITVRRGNTLYVNNELAGGYAETVFDYGRTTDAMFAGDFDGDGLDTISVRRGSVFIINDELEGGNVGKTLGYGRVGDDVFVGDWDGDQIDTPAVRR